MEKRQGPGLQGTGLSVYWGSTGQPRWIRPFWDIFFPQESHKMCSFQLLKAFKYTGLLGIHLPFFFFFVPRCTFNSNTEHRLYSMKCLNSHLVQTYRGSQSPMTREGRTEPSIQDSPGRRAPTCVHLPSALTRAFVAPRCAFARVSYSVVLPASV